MDQDLMTAKPFPITYHLLEDRDGSQDLEYLTFLARYLPEVEGRAKKPTGRTILDILPVCFTGPSREVAETKAMAFWDAETSRKQARIEQGKKLAARKRAA